MEKIYKPEIGWVFWAHLILILLVISPLLMIWTLMKTTGGIPIPILIILILVVVMSLLVVAKTLYTMDDEKLTVKGVFKTREIPYETVTKIISTNKGLELGEGLLVLSPDRIRILFGEEGKAAMSPREKPDALSTLRSKCPNAEYEEDLKAVKAKEEEAAAQESEPEEGSEEGSEE
ncbi:MAG: PH domain-containing protein [Methanomassiliicoccaceae archaeon]|nr:PH domain-containing protein [Methanomassiliicoccaceae archaeon]